MDHNNLIDIASFTPDSLEFPNAWVGHLPFASWLIREIHPKIFVELGTHSGNSYFSFCQSVLEAGLGTKCYAVDTWAGDEHAGEYGDDLFVKVNKHHQERYAGFSRLLRMTFDDAANYFADGSIDLLHIDGLHTYEAVRHDFDTWLPKLSTHAVVLFHDTNVRERGFGVWKLWEELQNRYPKNIAFLHSNGLGVLQLGESAADKKLDLLDPNSPDRHALQAYFAALGARQLERFELSEIRQTVVTLTQAVSERNLHIANLTEGIEDRDAHISNLERVVADREKVIAQHHEHIRNLEQAAVEREVHIAKVEHAFADQVSRLNQIIAARDAELLKVIGSKSWRWTRPMRVIWRAMRSVF